MGAGRPTNVGRGADTGEGYVTTGATRAAGASAAIPAAGTVRGDRALDYSAMNPTSTATDPAVDVSPILATGFAFWSSKVLLTAVEFGVFTRLAGRPTDRRGARRRNRHASARHQRFLRRAGRHELPRPRRRRSVGQLLQHPGRRALPGSQQPALRRRHPRDAQRAAVQVLARSAGSAAHRQAAERDQARPERDVRRALRRAAEARTVHGRDDRALADQLRGVRREVRLLAVSRPSATSAARPACCRSKSRSGIRI